MERSDAQPTVVDDSDLETVRGLTHASVTGSQVTDLVGRWLGKHQSAVDATYLIPTSQLLADGLAEELPWLRLLWEHGWSRWGWPPEVGGLGGGPRLRAMIYDAFRSLGYRLPERLNMLEVVGPTLIKYLPSAAAADIPLYLKGEQMWAQCFSEPEAGSDMGSLKTMARSEDDKFVVTGQKIWNSYGHVAQRAILLARTGTSESAHRGLSMLWIDMDSPGILARPIKQASGRDEFSEVFFDGACVPRSRLMGEVDGGWGVAMYLMQFERGMFSWWRQTIMNDRLNVAARAITQQGVSGPETSIAMARAYRVLNVLRSRAAATVNQLERGEAVGPQSSIDKVLLSQAERAVADLEEMVFYPAMEYGVDFHAEQLREDWFHSRAVSVYGGATEIQYDIIADRILGMPKEPRSGR